MSIRRLALTLCCALLPSLRAGAQAPSDAELISKVDAIATRALIEPGAAGLSIGVARGGRIVLERGYGAADLELGVPANESTIFRIGSVTKQFTAAAILKLVEQGKLSLDETLDRVLPDYPPTSKPVTIRHLLNHTSGVWSYTSDDEFMRRNASLDLTPEEMVALFRDKPLDFDPGSKFSYSNSGYYLLGVIVTKVSGKPYAQFVQDELFTPLGLAHTRYESRSEIIPGRAEGYTLIDGRLANDRYIGPDVPGAAGSLLSTAGDLLRWQDALSSGRAVTTESYALMTTPGMKMGEGDAAPSYGMGLAIGTWEGHTRIGHSGGIFGFTSILVLLPDDDGLGVAVIANSDSFNTKQVADSIARAALGIAEFVPADVDLTGDDVKRYTGSYSMTDPPLGFRFFEKEGKLYTDVTGQGEMRLLHQGGGEFRAAFDHNVRIVFAPGATPGDPAQTFTLFQSGAEIVAQRQP